MPKASSEEGPGRIGPAAGDEEQPEHDGRVEQRREPEQRAARVAVGPVPGGQREQRQRDEHRQADEPEVERVAPHRVDLPADRDERHLDGERRRSRDSEEENEIAVPERRVAARRRRVFLVYAASPSSPSAGSGVGQELDLDPLDPRPLDVEHREPQPVGPDLVAGLGRAADQVEDVPGDGVVVLVLDAPFRAPR